MIQLEGTDNLFGKKRKYVFEKIKRLQKPAVIHFYITKVDFIYIQILVNLLQLVLCIEYKMKNQNL